MPAQPDPIPASPAGWLRNVSVILNGRSMTMAEMRDYWASLDDKECSCMPGLGYICERHR